MLLLMRLFLQASPDLIISISDLDILNYHSNKIAFFLETTQYAKGRLHQEYTKAKINERLWDYTVYSLPQRYRVVILSIPQLIIQIGTTEGIRLGPILCSCLFQDSRHLCLILDLHKEAFADHLDDVTKNDSSKSPFRSMN